MKKSETRMKKLITRQSLKIRRKFHQSQKRKFSPKKR
jgi:hypothetical protein